MAPTIPADPSFVFQTYTTTEAQLRPQYLRVASQGSPWDWMGPASQRLLLKHSAYLLEMLALVLSLTEAAAEAGYADVGLGDIPEKERGALMRRAQTVCGLDVRAIQQNAAALRHGGKGGPPVDLPPITLMVGIVTARSLISSVPIDQLEQMGHDLGEPALAHRCRVAYECIRHFLVRFDTQLSERVRVIGRAYAFGILEAVDVATVLEVTPADAADLLQRVGYHRTPDAVTLTAEQRATRLGHIREDRLRRAGEPDYSPSYVDRDVIASQRIEDVDARPWLVLATEPKE